jgi:hypothetical protein
MHAAGNLTFDGRLVYQYDALNRLLQVNQPGDAAFGADGRLVAGGLGELICRYVYDGVGRLIQKQTPINVGETNLQTKDFYYDGVRRIQESITRPLEKLASYAPGTFATSGPAENDERVLERTDGERPVQDIRAPIDSTAPSRTALERSCPLLGCSCGQSALFHDMESKGQPGHPPRF